ncbi:hypothetical protein RRG08_003909 [Elysia crispata]|uniref:Uncharacterized protein n=1 Tax=Elysia crispata TaxID=231223 RepID=A0AAE0YUL8_9GAST|nr:hypothetical protein RRG08_003909 [Elysia crispata]
MHAQRALRSFRPGRVSLGAPESQWLLVVGCWLSLSELAMRNCRELVKQQRVVYHSLSMWPSDEEVSEDSPNKLAILSHPRVAPP